LGTKNAPTAEEAAASASKARELLRFLGKENLAARKAYHAIDELMSALQETPKSAGDDMEE
jgi:hypothetical protein